ncbi:MAG: inorganic phosphate transporter [Archaeoglobaceae archaeon]
MFEASAITPLVAFILIAFSIGSNDTSNAFGICIGCRILSLRKATFLLFSLAILGIFLQGEKVMETVGSDLIELSMEVSAIAMSVSALMIVLSNFRGLPVSTHQVIIGSITGAGVACGMKLSLSTLAEILLSWAISPFVAGIFAITIFTLLERMLRKYPIMKAEKILKSLLFISSVLIAYNTGANELATAIAPVLHVGIFNLPILAIFGAFFLWLGAFLLSFRVIETVCKKITSLDPKSGLSAHLGAGIAVFSFTTLGMPVSTTYAMIGGITTVGLAKGVRTVSFETLRKIIFNWFFAPLSSFLISFLIAKLLIL